MLAEIYYTQQENINNNKDATFDCKSIFSPQMEVIGFFILRTNVFWNTCSFGKFPSFLIGKYSVLWRI